ncbi:MULTISPECIES: glycoside hydrolase family 27 protein [unclassified Streptomyces]|uniref:glycoside hydrolase family 27 protein n=1 Tax=Streptomyces sp. SID4940 TaxID=2690282 RepID=UPI00081E0ED1|nr:MULTISPECIES: glycoside hydrolase family 27 protein [unclassified Streptomyces]SCD40520.1 alpha-galactosidase [Streptomyces sp. DpondAA-F4a]
MTPARRAAVAVGAAALLAVPVPAAHAGQRPDQGAPPSHGSNPAATPYMGWNTYYGLGAPTETEVREIADFLVGSGLKSSGYDIVWLDGGWQADDPRDGRGRLVAHPDRFPSGIPALVDYLHERGLRAGIYTDAGTYDGGETCGLGSRGHYQEDARQFAGWKVDAIKVDFLCGITEKLDPGPAFKEFGDAVAKSGRRMLLNLCNPLTDDWGIPHTPAQDAHNAYVYGPTTADSWRTGTDIAWGTPSAGQWPNVLRNMDANAWHPEAQGPGHYNDPDYLIPMRTLQDGSYELTAEESTTQLVMWAEMGSPLVIGSDPRTLPRQMIDTLRNPEIIAVDQDPLAIQGVRVATDATGDVYSKVLQGSGRRAVVLLNRSDRPAERTVDFADAGLAGKVGVRDLRARKDRGKHTGSYTVEVPAHGTAFLTLTGRDDAPGASLGVRSDASPALVRDGDRVSVFTRGADGSLRQRTGHEGRGTRGPPVSAVPRTGGSWERPSPTRTGTDASTSSSGAPTTPPTGSPTPAAGGAGGRSSADGSRTAPPSPTRTRGAGPSSPGERTDASRCAGRGPAGPRSTGRRTRRCTDGRRWPPTGRGAPTSPSAPTTTRSVPGCRTPPAPGRTGRRWAGR